MGHCISVYLLKKEDVRNEKLDVILEDKSIGIKLTDLGEGIFATVDIPNFNEFTKGKNIAHITTDYFGGSGNQSATLGKSSTTNQTSKIGLLNQLMRF